MQLVLQTLSSIVLQFSEFGGEFALYPPRWFGVHALSSKSTICLSKCQLAVISHSPTTPRTSQPFESKVLMIHIADFRCWFLLLLADFWWVHSREFSRRELVSASEIVDWLRVGHQFQFHSSSLNWFIAIKRCVLLRFLSTISLRFLGVSSGNCAFVFREFLRKATIPHRWISASKPVPLNHTRPNRSLSEYVTLSRNVCTGDSARR